MISLGVGAVAVLGFGLGPGVPGAAGGLPTVEIVAANGAGCTKESATVEANADGFVVRYSAYAAQIGGDARPTDARKNCQLNLKIGLPEGLTYAVDGSVHRGSAQLKTGTNGLIRASHYYAGSPLTHEVRHEIKGPADDEWVAEETVGSDQLTWVRCGERWNLSISSELRLSASDKSKVGVLDMNSALGSSYHFRWRTCP